MNTVVATADGFPIRCSVCGNSALVNISNPPGDSICPSCGTLLWVSALIEVTQRNAFVPDLQIAHLPATGREHAFQLLAEATAESLGWTRQQTKQFHQELVRREQLGSTGIGRGIAVPHGRVDWLDRCFTIMACVPEGIDFASIDERPVDTIIMLAAPKSRPGDALRQLELISRSLRCFPER